MQTIIEQVEKNVVKLTITVSPEKFEEGVQKAYHKVAKQVNIPGFRKGKAPRKLIERYYGAGVFYDEAVNAVCPDAYDEAVKETGIEPVDRPDVDIEKIGAEDGLVFTAKVTVKPEVILGAYKGIEVEKMEYNVTDEDVMAEINRLREKNSRLITVEDRTVLNDDIVTIDYEGFVDGIPFEGGKGEGFDLTIGSGQFIPGFEEQLIGKAIGDETEVNVTFPEEYHAEDLKGKLATFEVKIHAIKVKEYPELDDEFAKDVSEFDTLEAYKNDIRSKQEEANATKAKNELENKILKIAVDNATIEIPEVMIESQIDREIKDFEMRLRNQGLQLDMYMQYTGMTEASMRAQFKEQAENQVKNTLVIEKIAKEENIEITEEDINEEYTKIAEMYKMDIEKVKEMMGTHQDSMKDDISMRKAVEMVVSQAVIK